MPYLIRVSFIIFLLAGKLYDASAEVIKAPLSYLDHLKTSEDFVAMARSYKEGRFKNVDHVMFLIDRPQRKIYFINSKQYKFHGRFARDQYLTLEEDKEFFRKNYYSDKRQFILGSLVHRKNQQYIIELWEGDNASILIWQECYALIRQHVKIASIAIKPNSLQQEEVLVQWPSGNLKKPTIITWDDAFKLRDIEIVNHGTAIGRLIIYANNNDKIVTAQPEEYYDPQKLDTISPNLEFSF